MGYGVGTSLLLGLALSVACSSRFPGRLIALEHEVWAVDSDGRIAPFPYEFAAGYNENLFGTTAPWPSPDSRWIVFGRNLDLHLLNVATRQEQQITHLGRPYVPGRYAPVDVLATAWSADSRRLLFTVAPGEVVCEYCDDSVRIAQAPYGLHIYDVVTGASHPLALPKAFQFQAWLPDGSLLGIVPQREPCKKSF